MKGLNPYVVPLLIVLADDMMYLRKTGIFPSQKRILNELGIKSKIYRCIRTINRWLAFIQSQGLIRRKKRHKKDSVLGWIFRSSLYTITGPGWDLVIRNSKYTWDQFNSLIKEAKATFRKPKKTRKVERPSGSLTHVGEVIKGLRFDTS